MNATATKKATVKPLWWKRLATLFTDSISNPAKNQTMAMAAKKRLAWDKKLITIRRNNI